MMNTTNKTNCGTSSPTSDVTPPEQVVQTQTAVDTNAAGATAPDETGSMFDAAAKANILLPNQRATSLRGPVEMSIGNHASNTDTRRQIQVDRPSQNVGYAEADMSKQVQRLKRIGYFGYSNSDALGKVLQTYTTQQIVTDIATADVNFAAYQYWRANIELTMTVSNNPTAAGYLMLVFIPDSASWQSKTTYSVVEMTKLTLFSHALFPVHKQSGQTITGHYMLPRRYNEHSDDNKYQFGRVEVIVWNPLNGSFNIDCTVFARLVDASFRFYKLPPKAPAPDTVSRALAVAFKHQDRDTAVQNLLAAGLTIKEIMTIFPAHTAGDTDSTETPAQQDTENVTVDDRAYDTGAEPATLPRAEEHHVGGVKAPVQGGWNHNTYTNVQQALTRPAYIARFPAAQWAAGNILQLFSIGMTDLAKLLHPTSAYIYYSGTMRLHYMSTATFATPVILRITFGDTFHYLNLSENRSGCVEFPWYSNFPTNTFIANSSIVTPLVSATLETEGTMPADLAITFLLSVGDDFRYSHPQPFLPLNSFADVWPYLDDKANYSFYPSGQPQAVTAGVADVVGDVVDVAKALGPVADVAAEIFGAFHKPPQPVGPEWPNVNSSQPVQRMAMLDNDYTAVDTSVVQFSANESYSDAVSYAKHPGRFRIVDFPNTATQGEVLTTFQANPAICPFFDATRLSYNLWRGTIRLTAEVVLTIFNKGMFAVVLHPVGTTVTADTWSDYSNVVVDTSERDSVMVDVPFANTVDYLPLSASTVSVSVVCVNAPQVTETSGATGVEINLYAGVGDDFEYKFAPKQGVAIPLAAPPADRRPAGVGRPSQLSVPHLSDFKSDTETLMPPPGHPAPKPLPKAKSHQRTFAQVVAQGPPPPPPPRFSFTDKRCSESVRKDAAQLTHCNTRVRTTTSVDVYMYRHRQLPQRSCFAWSAGFDDFYGPYVHAHGPHSCARVYHTSGQREQALRVLGDFRNESLPETEICNLGLLPEWNPFHKTKIPVRKRHHKLCITLFAVFQGRLVRARVRRYDDFRLEERMSQALQPVTAGVWDWIMPSRVRERAEEAVSRGVENIKAHTKGLAAGPAIAIALSKIPAYALQISDASSTSAYLSVILHFIGDITAWFSAHSIVTKFLERLKDSVMTIIDRFFNTTTKADDDSDEVVIEEEGYISGYLKWAYGLFKGLLGKLASYAPPFTTFLTWCRNLCAVGGAVRALASIFSLIVSGLKMIGFCMDEREKQLKELSTLVRDGTYTMNIGAMTTLCARSIHTVQSDPNTSLAAQELRRYALSVIPLLKSANTPIARREAQVVSNYLRWSETLPVTGIRTENFEPVFVLLEGRPGVGKSTSVNGVAAALMKQFGVEGEPFHMQLEADHDSGYCGQAVIIIDDLFQDPKGTGVDKLATLISPVPRAMNMADLASKGQMCSAYVVIGTTNNSTIKQDWSRCPQAIRRRWRNTHFACSSTSDGSPIFHPIRDDTNYPDLETPLDIHALTTVIIETLNKKWEKHVALKKKLEVKPAVTVCDGLKQAIQKGMPDHVRIPSSPTFDTLATPPKPPASLAKQYCPAPGSNRPFKGTPLGLTAASDPHIPSVSDSMIRSADHEEEMPALETPSDFVRDPYAYSSPDQYTHFADESVFRTSTKGDGDHDSSSDNTKKHSHGSCCTVRRDTFLEDTVENSYGGYQGLVGCVVFRRKSGEYVRLGELSQESELHIDSPYDKWKEFFASKNMEPLDEVEWYRRIGSFPYKLTPEGPTNPDGTVMTAEAFARLWGLWICNMSQEFREQRTYVSAALITHTCTKFTTHLIKVDYNNRISVDINAILSQTSAMSIALKAAVSFGVLIAGIGVSYLAGKAVGAVIRKVTPYLGGSAAATYDPKATKKTQRPEPNIVPPSGTTKGLHQKLPIISRNLISWRSVEGSDVNNVNALVIGSGYVLVPSHACRVGSVCTAIFGSPGNVLKEINIPITDQNTAVMAVGDGENRHGADVSLVYMGVGCPTKRDITSYFVTNAQYQSIRDVAVVATVRFPKSGEVKQYASTAWYTPAVSVTDERPGTSRTFVQDCFTSTVPIDRGNCGSILQAVPAHLDGCIIGFANASNVLGSFWMTPTQEWIVKAKRHLSQTVSAPIGNISPNKTAALYEQGVTLDQREEFDSRMQAKQDSAGRPPLTIPMVNPQFIPVALDEDPYDPVKPNDFVPIPESSVPTIALSYPKKFPSMGNPHVPEVVAPGVRGNHDGSILVNVPPPFRPQSDEYMQAVNILVTHYKKHIAPCRLLTYREVVNGVSVVDGRFSFTANGINRNSVSGRRMDEKFGKKSRGKHLQPDHDADTMHLDGKVEDYISECERSLRHGKPVDDVALIAYKGELRSEAKHIAGKTRAIYITGMEYYVLFARYIGYFIGQYRARNLALKHTLGTDPPTTWDGLAKWLGKSVFAGDVKGWDTNLNPMLLETVRYIIEQFYPPNDQERRVRAGLMAQNTWTAAVFGEFQYIVTGQKSGIFATTEINSIVHNFIQALMIVKLYGSLAPDLPLHYERLPAVCHGDDSLTGRVHDYSEVQQLAAIRHAYKVAGMRLTGANKSDVLCFEDITTAQYLKRTFHSEGDHFYPRMGEETISGLLTYRHKGVPHRDNYCDALAFLRQGRHPDLSAVAWFGLVEGIITIDDVIGIHNRYTHPPWDDREWNLFPPETILKISCGDLVDFAILQRLHSRGVIHDLFRYVPGLDIAPLVTLGEGHFHGFVECFADQLCLRIFDRDLDAHYAVVFALAGIKSIGGMPWTYGPAILTPSEFRTAKLEIPALTPEVQDRAWRMLGFYLLELLAAEPIHLAALSNGRLVVEEHRHTLLPLEWIECETTDLATFRSVMFEIIPDLYNDV